MFQKILIANRGEIAVRIIRACRELGITSVAVYSTADKDALHTQLADEAICIGKAAPADSYLNMERILSAAIASKAEAIHPGFGFLSENAKFAQMCEQCHIAFIGPSAEVIRRMGNKQEARNTMINAKVPVVPGTKEAVYTADYGLKLAEQIGFPVMIKAASGGGGKGMRISHSREDFTENFEVAQTESVNGFADDTMYIEKYIEDPRHIEFQILADKYGNVISLGERDCSIQRRHQKLLEEAPSPALDETLRRNMAVAAVKAVRAVDYRNAGTIEFLLDNDGKFYFMEMNTRVQVEHPVTEQITGVDIIKEQLRIASGEPMSCADEAPFVPNGHAIEFRINAEDPENGFRPCPGTITRFDVPGGPGVRVEAYVQAGSVISPFYDSMVAKLIVWGRDRDEALARGRRALSEFNIEGIATTIPFHQAVLENEIFQRGEAHTDFIEVTGL